jgi:hypothetical protein
MSRRMCYAVAALGERTRAPILDQRHDALSSGRAKAEELLGGPGVRSSHRSSGDDTEAGEGPRDRHIPRQRPPDLRPS